jgi:hypothetical protein
MGIDAEPAIDDPMTGGKRQQKKATINPSPQAIVCALRPPRSVVGAEESLRRGRTKEMGKKKEASRLTGPPLI